MNPQKLIETMLAHLKFDHATVEVATKDDQLTKIDITVPEEESGILIGYRGEKINALQLLVSIMINQEKDDYQPVQIDINGYRQKRIDQLEDMAQKAADKALSSGKEIVLPPMNAYERRIMHVYTDQINGVTTYSEGEGKSRRVIVSPTE